MAGDANKKPYVKILDGIDFIVRCGGYQTLGDNVKLIRGFYTKVADNIWMNQRKTARIIYSNGTYYFNTNMNDINDKLYVKN